MHFINCMSRNHTQHILSKEWQICWTVNYLQVSLLNLYPSWDKGWTRNMLAIGGGRWVSQWLRNPQTSVSPSRSCENSAAPKNSMPMWSGVGISQARLRSYNQNHLLSALNLGYFCCLIASLKKNQGQKEIIKVQVSLMVTRHSFFLILFCPYYLKA